VSIGADLADARRRAGLTVTQVSQRTCIRETLINGIERDDYAACGGDFYTRGHIRAIAKVVGAGCGVIAAQAIIAEIGLDMTVFGTPGPLVSWARRCPQTHQSRTKTTTGKAGKGTPCLNAVLGEIAASAGRTDTFPGERYRRLARRRGKRKAVTAAARSVLVIIFHLLASPQARFHDLGPDCYDNRISTERKIANHVRQLQALGLTVTLTPAQDAA